MAQGDSHARTRKGRDGRGETNLKGLPLAAMAGAARARQTREPFRFLQVITSGSILPRASTHDEGVGTGVREVREQRR
jgi:hypothetical protein